MRGMKLRRVLLASPNSATEMAGGRAPVSSDAGNRAGPAEAIGSGPSAGPAAGPFVYVSGYSPLIRIFQLDMASGALALKATSDGGTSPSYLAFRPDKRFLYALNETNPGRIVAFAIDQTTGELTRINDAPSGGDGPAHLSVHPGGKWVLASNYGSGHVATLEIMADGGVAAPRPENIVRPVRQHAHQIISDISGKHVFVPSPEPGPQSTMGLIAQMSIDVTTGHMTANDLPFAVSASDGRPRHLAFHTNGIFAYHVNETGSSVVSWHYDVANGTLSDPETVSSLPPGYEGTNDCANVVIHPGGRFVYASNRGHDSIATFAVNATTGRLGHPTWEMGGGATKTPRDFKIDRTGTYLLVANQTGNTVLTFRINQTDGTLTKVGTPAVATDPAFVGLLQL